MNMTFFNVKNKTFQKLISPRSSSEVANRRNRSNAFASDSGVLKSNSGDSNFDIANSNLDPSNSNPSNFNLANFDFDFGVNISQFSLHNMANNNRTLKELATPDVMYQPWCIQYPKLEQSQSYELKSRLIHLLPKFHALVGKNPYKHLKELHVVCSPSPWIE
ncbi:hypothetical protein CR513_29148, partial [Mucuna pruriens]